MTLRLSRLCNNRCQLALFFSLTFAYAFAQITTQSLATGLARPTCIAFPAGDSRLFVTEQYSGSRGRVRILKNGSILSTPFLTVEDMGLGTEQGLIGLVFHPSYASNGYFYVCYADPQLNVHIVRYTVSENPDVANPNSAYPILTIARPRENHNGGTMHFGSDGFMYFGMGDSGGGYDPDNAAQNKDLLLGKILRIDVDHDDFPLDTSKNYAIPSTNPFVGVDGADEVYQYGLRNPWKHRFDSRANNGFDGQFIADVGQDSREEISYIDPSQKGRNLGWRLYEGTLETGLGGGTGPFHDPVFDYSHENGCSISGGVLYRGVRLGPQYYGRYFFSDYCGGFLWSVGMFFDPVTGEGVFNGFQDHNVNLQFGVTSMDEDQDGEIVYVRVGGAMRRIVSTSPRYGAFGTIEFQDLESGAVKPNWAIIELRNHGSSNNLYSFPIGLDGTGKFRVPTTNANIDLSVKRSHWLRKTVNVNTTAADANNVVFSLINGDVAEDNEINLVDFGMLSASFGSVPGDTEWNSNADLNGDLEVNLFDFGIVSANFGLSGDP